MPRVPSGSPSGRPENPYPGKLGTTMSNESAASPPWAAGSVSSG